MTEKRYIYANIGIGYEILDSWFGYTGDDKPTEREIEEYDYLVIGLASNQDAAEGICRRLNDQQDEINASIEELMKQAEIEEENEQLKSEIRKQSKQCTASIQMFKEENEQLKSENNMLRVTIGRNEAYIDRLTHESVWSNKSMEVRD